MRAPLLLTATDSMITPVYRYAMAYSRTYAKRLYFEFSTKNIRS